MNFIITMADEEQAPQPPPAAPEPAAPATAAPDKESSTATLEAPKTAPGKGKPKQMPRWRVMLHNDDVNSMPHVSMAILRVTPLGKAEAVIRMLEAHHNGVALLLTTHQELAELYQEQLTSYGLTVTIEPET